MPRGKSLKKKLAETFSESNLETIREFENRCNLMNLSKDRTRNYLSYLIYWGKIMPKKSFKELTRKDIQKMIVTLNDAQSIRGGEYSPWTKRTLLLSLRKIVQFAHGYEWDSEEFPECLKDIRFKRLAPIKTTLTRKDILTKEEIYKMVDHCDDERDKAWLMLSYDTGWRPDEIYNLKVGDIEFAESGVMLTINGYKRKHTQRLLVVHSTRALMDWMNRHPDRKNPDAPVWCYYRQGSRKKLRKVCKNYFRRRMKIWAERAGLKKKVWPYLLRHSAITHNNYDLNSAQKKIWFGWVPKSNMEGHYTHLSDDDVNDAIKSKHITKLSKEPKEPHEQRRCIRCEETNSPERDFCSRCGMALTVEGVKIANEKLIDNQKKMLMDLIDQRLREDNFRDTHRP